MNIANTCLLSTQPPPPAHKQTQEPCTLAHLASIAYPKWQWLAKVSDRDVSHQRPAEILYLGMSGFEHGTFSVQVRHSTIALTPSFLLTQISALDYHYK